MRHISPTNLGLLVVAALAVFALLWWFAPSLVDASARWERRLTGRWARFAQWFDAKFARAAAPLDLVLAARIRALPAPRLEPKVTTVYPQPRLALPAFLPDPPEDDAETVEEPDPIVDEPEPAPQDAWPPIPPVERHQTEPVPAWLGDSMTLPVLPREAYESDITTGFRKLTDEYLEELDTLIGGKR